MAPPKGPDTRQIRVYEPVAEKLWWLAEFENRSIAEIVDEIAGAAIDRRFAKIESRVAIVKAAKAGDPTPLLAPDLGGEG